MFSCSNNRATSMFALASRGVKGAAAPFILYDVILRARPQTAWRPKDLVLTELFLGQRGAITRGAAVNYHKTTIKYFVRTFKSQHK